MAITRHRGSIPPRQQAFWLSSAILVTLALAVSGACAASALGWLPWLSLTLTFGDTVFPQAGVAVQCAVALLLLLLVAYLPSGHRVNALERTHRDFQITMSDVAEAYRLCHAADRAGAFTLSDEFDAVKERIAFLRQHPDLGHLEPEVLEAAAQMSRTSEELAEIYSDEKLARAEAFLKARQEEIATFQERIEQATAQGHRLRRWLDEVEMEEDIAQSRLRQLEDQFGDVLETLGFTRRDTATVIRMPGATAAE